MAEKKEIIIQFGGAVGNENFTSNDITIVGSESQKNRIKQVMEDHFYKGEIKVMEQGDGVIVNVHKTPDGGNYSPKTKNKPIPVIQLDPECRDDTIIHEFVHHIRNVDKKREGITRTPLPLDKDGKINYSKELEKYVGDIKNAEEAETVTETTARIGSQPRKGLVTGYYLKIKGINFINAYEHDRKLLTGDPIMKKNLRGKKVTDSVTNNYDKTMISRAIIYPNETEGRTAIESREKLKEVGIIEQDKKE